MDLEKVVNQVSQAAQCLLDVADLKPGQILVLGGSTSEIIGKPIGTAGNLRMAEAIVRELLEIANQNQVFLAVQCCEHLNRALVVEAELAARANLEVVSVYPVAKAGGSMAAMAMELFREPVVVEAIRADAGLDIGGTLIGMHLKQVAVPVRLDIRKIGEAPVTAARTRPKLIGGERAVYRPSNEGIRL